MFHYLVLGLLRFGEAQQGYAVMKEYRARAGVGMSTGNFYRELQRLVAEGLVCTDVGRAGADARRTPYQITEAGADAFDAWLASPAPVDVTQCEDELSSRALFIADADPSMTRRLLDRWRDELWTRSKILERIREAAIRPPGDRQFGALRLLLARRLKHIAADLDFLEELRMAHEGWLARPGASVTANEGSIAAPTRRRQRRPERRCRR